MPTATSMLIAALLVAWQAVPDDVAMKNAHTFARACLEATVKNDLESLVDLTHPALVKAMGGRQQYIERVRETAKKMKEEDGFTPVSVASVSAPDEIYSSKGEYYCVSPYVIRVNLKDSRLLLNGALIGVSIDSGKTWKFLDGAVGIKTLLPDLPPNLKLPPKPRLVRDESPPKS